MDSIERLIMRLMTRLQLLQLLLLALIGSTQAGQSFLFPQSACRVRCENGGVCAFDTEDPSIHSCICLEGVFEGERCERLVPGAVDPAAAITTTATTTRAPETTPSAYELERRRHEEQRIRHMEERRKHEEERARMEEERRRIMEERARLEEQRRVEAESRGRADDEARRRAMEQQQAQQQQRQQADEDRRRAEHEQQQRQLDEERRREEDELKVAEERRRLQQPQQQENNVEQHHTSLKVDYPEYEDDMAGQHMEEVHDPNAIDEEEDEEVDRVVESDDDEEEETDETTTPEPTKAVTYTVDHDYVTSTTPSLQSEAKADDSRMSGEDDDYWDHTPEHQDVDDEGNKELPPLPGASEERDETVRGTQIDKTGNPVGPKQSAGAGGSFADDEDGEEQELEESGDGWMMVKNKQTASSSTMHQAGVLAVAAAFAVGLL